MRRSGSLMRLWLGVVLAILYLPLLVMVLMSFNRSRYGVLPFEFSLRWYEQVFGGGPIVESVVTSFWLAAAVSVSATAFGLGLALWANQSKSRWIGNSLNAVLVSSIAIPLLILSLGMFFVVNQLGLGTSFVSVWLGCTAVSLPFAVFVISARLESLDADLVRASATLGAGRVQTFVRITVPQVLSALIAGLFISFVVAFNNFPVQLFLSPIGFETFPVHIFTKTRVGVTPEVNSMATIVLLGTALLVGAVQMLTGNAGKFVSSESREETADVRTNS